MFSYASQCMFNPFVFGLIVATVCPWNVAQTAAPSEANSALTGKRPNIVLIMADDLGFSDLGCYGSEIETPNLDRLAEGGLRFNQFYNTAKCHSSRICLLTGLYMFQAGNQKMNRGVTLAEALKPAGYEAFMAGKWHLDGQPTDRGFDRYFGHLSGATNFFTGDDTFRLDGKPYKVAGDDFYTTDVMTDYAIEFLSERDTTKPFLMYIAYNAPHYPLHVKENDFKKYEGRYDTGWDRIREARFAKQKQLGLLPKAVLSPRPPEVAAWESLSTEEQKWESERMSAFAGMVDCVDQNVGRLLEHLEKTGQRDNTLFMFCSDNGACPFERTKGKELRPWDPKSYWTYDVGWAHVGNTPFRWYKQNQHEGGISSPMIVSWSGLQTQPGSITSQPAHLIDFMATCVDAAQAEYPTKFGDREITPLQGKSLLPIFSGKKRKPHEWLYFQFSNNRAIRSGDEKLVSVKGRPWELYDLSEDRSELKDLSIRQPTRAKALEKLWFHVAEKVEQAPKNLRKPIKPKSKIKK